MTTKTIVLNTTADLATAYCVERVAGIWAIMSTGGDAVINCFAVDPTDGTVYAGGAFTGIGGTADTKKIAYWNGTAWVALAEDLDGNVHCMAVAPNGDLWVGGAFTDIDGGGGGTYNRIGYYDGSSWNAADVGMNNTVDTIAIDSGGNIYIGGTFTDIQGGGLANANYFAKWTGAAWTACGTGMNALVNGLAVDASDNVYVTGDFTTGNAVTLNYVGMWNGTTFVAMAGSTTGLGDAGGTAVVIAPNGLVYIAGDTTDFGGVTANYIAAWNGSAYTALGTGFDEEPLALAVDDAGNLYAVGEFTTADGMAIAKYLARWNGSLWEQLDIDLPGAAVPVAVLSFQDRLYIGFATTGTATTSGEPASTITNSSTLFVYPKFIFTRSGGTTAVLESIKNLTTGKQLLFNHGLLDGEKIVIDLAPGKKSVKTIAGSSTSSANRDMLASSDFGSFALLPGANDIRTYISRSGAPTIGAFVQWEQRYAGVDGATS